ncbi:MAG: serine hydrolase [Lachnospiraceae bacterium]|nr:serine hydrolase [Lachnospiraceae bacterium]
MDQKKIGELEQKINNDYGNTIGMVILKDGTVSYEKYFNGCTADSRVHVYSVTKSIISALIGIALDKGCIKDMEEKVLDFFPEYKVKKGETTIQNITLKDMLVMTAPYKYRFFAPYVKYFTSSNWVEFSLDLLGGRGKIGTFRYAPLIGPDILSGILVKATGQSVFDFAAENLFSPLGITVEKSLTFQNKEEQMAFNRSTDISGWVVDPMGTHAAGWGLTLTPMDMAKIGQLYLNGGMWADKQIISGKWIEESTTEHSRWKKQNLPYGYLWWLNEDGYAAMGDGGNIIYVNTRKKLVVSIAALFVPKAGDRIKLIKEYVEPVF